jgi:hypothetical protein
LIALPSGALVILAVGAILQRFFPKMGGDVAGSSATPSSSTWSTLLRRAGAAAFLPSSLMLIVSQLLEGIVSAVVVVASWSADSDRAADLAIIILVALSYGVVVIHSRLLLHRLFASKEIVYVTNFRTTPYFVGTSAVLLGLCEFFFFGRGQWAAAVQPEPMTALAERDDDDMPVERASSARGRRKNMRDLSEAADLGYPDEASAQITLHEGEAHALEIESHVGTAVDSTDLPSKVLSVSDDGAAPVLPASGLQLKFIFTSYRGDDGVTRESPPPSTSHTAGSALPVAIRSFFRPAFFYHLSLLTALSTALIRSVPVRCTTRLWVLLAIQAAYAVLTIAIRPQRVPASNGISAASATATAVGFACLVAAVYCTPEGGQHSDTSENLRAAAQTCAAIVSALSVASLVRTVIRVILTVIDKLIRFRDQRRRQPGGIAEEAKRRAAWYGLFADILDALNGDFANDTTNHRPYATSYDPLEELTAALHPTTARAVEHISAVSPHRMRTESRARELSAMLSRQQAEYRRFGYAEMRMFLPEDFSELEAIVSSATGLDEEGLAAGLRADDVDGLLGVLLTTRDDNDDNDSVPAVDADGAAAVVPLSPLTRRRRDSSHRDTSGALEGIVVLPRLADSAAEAEAGRRYTLEADGSGTVDDIL